MVFEFFLPFLSHPTSPLSVISSSASHDKSTMTKTKVGILGAGFAATFHAMALKEMADVELVSVGAKTQGHAERFAKRWGIRNSYHGEQAIEKLTGDPDVEVVDIVLPNFLHRDAVVAAAERKKNVIVEKPLARNRAEAKEMLRAVERHGVLHGYAENQLFTPQMERSLDMFRKGTIGDILWVRSREAHFGPHSAWFWDPDLAGGGVLMDMGCHSVEVDRKIVNKKPVEAFCWGATLHHRTKAEDNSLIVVRYEDGKIGQSENSWTARGGLDIRFEVYGTDGVAFVDITRETGIRMFTVASEEKVGYVVEKAETKRGWMFPIWREHQVYGYLSELQHFIDCFRRGEMPTETLSDGYVVNAILDAGYASMRSGRWERIDI